MGRLGEFFSLSCHDVFKPKSVVMQNRGSNRNNNLSIFVMMYFG